MKRLIFTLLAIVTTVVLKAQYFGDPQKALPLQDDSVLIFSVADFDNDGILDIATNRVFFLDKDRNVKKEVYLINPYTDFNATGNFNNDNLIDLVGIYVWDWYNHNTNILYFKFNTGNQTFTSYNKTLTGIDFIKQLSVADINKDGYDDVVITAYNNLGYVLSNGDGTFADYTMITDTLGYATLSTYDMDGDGDADIIISADDKNKTYWYENNNGSFSSAHLIYNQAYNYIFPKDINKDGRVDFLAVAGNTLLWLENTGTGFTPHEINTNLSVFSGATIADINGDGNNDIITTQKGWRIAYPYRFYGRLILWKNLGNNTFVPDTLLDIPAWINHPNFIDFDNDGIKDIVFNLSGSSYIPGYFYLKGQGNGKFIKNFYLKNVIYNGISNYYWSNIKNFYYARKLFLVEYYCWYCSINFSYLPDTLINFNAAFNSFNFVDTNDFNADNNYDLLYASNDSGLIAISYYENNAYTEPDIVGSFKNFSLTQANSADINHDGLTDIVLSDTALWVYRNTGSSFNKQYLVSGQCYFTTGKFRTDTNYIIAYNTGTSNFYFFYPDFSYHTFANLSGIKGLITFNLDQDNLDDFVAFSNDTIYIFKNLGEGNFQIVNKIPKQYVKKIIAFDYDQDGDDDLIVDYTSSNTSYHYISLYLNLDKQGQFSNEISILSDLTSWYFHGFQITDFDNDGLKDILYNYGSYDNANFYYLKNLYKENKYQKNITDTTCADFAIITDENNDGLNDLWLNGNSLKLLRGTGDNFLDTVVADTNAITCLSYADINADGKKDIIWTSFDADSVYYNPFNGSTYAPACGLFPVPHALCLDTGDVDHDGDLDIVAGNNQANTIYLYKNDGAATPSAPVILNNLTADSISCIRLRDINGDNNLDIIYSSYRDGKLQWLAGDGSGGFSAPSVISNVDTGIVSLRVADIDNDGDLDIFTATEYYPHRSTRAYINDGTGNFTLIIIADTIGTPSSIDVADINGDNVLEILISSTSDNKILAYHYNGAGFEFYKTISANANNVQFVRAADMDNDGDNDIVSLENDGVVIYKTLTPVITVQPVNDTVGYDPIAQFSIQVKDQGWIHWYSYDGNTATRLKEADPFSGVSSTQLTINPVDASMHGLRFFAFVGAGDDSISTDTVMLFLIDRTPPTLQVKDTAWLALNQDGEKQITVNDVVISASDNLSGINHYEILPSWITCVNLNDTIPVAISVYDSMGNYTADTTWVIAIDTLYPSLNVHNATLYLDQNGQAQVYPQEVITSATDNCSVMDTTITGQTVYSCSDTGSHQIIITVSDAAGNQTTKTATITVLDTISPTLIVNDDTLYLDQNGLAGILPWDVITSAIDNCYLTDTTTLSQSIFDCSNLGNNLIWISVKDASGNTDTAVVTITVLDTISPTLSVSNDTLYLDQNGQATIYPWDVISSATDNCTIVDTTISGQTTYACSDIGQHQITITVSDATGNQISQTATITVADTIKPTLAVHNTTVYLDQNGQANINPFTLIDNATDNCWVVDTSFSGKTSFSCDDIGENPITISITDAAGNQTSATALVSVVDNIAPVLTTVQNDTIFLDQSGQASINPADVVASASDNCSVVDTTISQNIFDCSNLGNNQIWVVIRDAAGNMDTAVTNVFVMDTLSPTLIVHNTTVYLDQNGQATINPLSLIDNATDNCSVVDTSFTGKTSFSCYDLGTHQITFTVKDWTGNQTVATAYITVIDSINPTVTAKDATIYLDKNGLARVYLWDVLIYMNDNCFIVDTTISQNIFDCSNLGNNQIWVKVRDVAGNSDSTIANVQVLDTIRPVLTVHDTILYLSEGDTARLDANNLISEATDNCGITSTYISKQYFTSIDVGTTYDTVIVGDISGNYAIAIATVTVVMQSTSITEINRSSIKIYPNPTNGHITIVVSPDMTDSKFILTDINGRVLYSRRINSDKEEFNISFLPQGVYIGKIINSKGQAVYRIIKE